MSLHPDAATFVQAILRDPAEITTRLVFADWLEEAGDPSSVAWAQFIRLMASTDPMPNRGRVRRERNRHLMRLASQITTTLHLNAEQLVGCVEYLHRLLPQPNFHVSLAGYPLLPEVIELIPESVAVEHLVIPLAVQGNRLLAAAVKPNDAGTRRTLEFILNRELSFVGVERELFEAAVDHSYQRWPLDTFASHLVLMDSEDVIAHSRVYFEPTAPQHIQNIDPDEPFNPIYLPGPVQRLVWSMLFEAIKLESTRIQIGPTADCAEVRYLFGEEWELQDAMPLRLLGPLADEIARVAGLHSELEKVGLASGELPEINGDNGVIHTIQGLITMTGEGPIIDLRIGTRPPDEDGW